MHLAIRHPEHGPGLPEQDPGPGLRSWPPSWDVLAGFSRHEPAPPPGSPRRPTSSSVGRPLHPDGAAGHGARAAARVPRLGWADPGAPGACLGRGRVPRTAARSARRAATRVTCQRWEGSGVYSLRDGLAGLRRPARPGAWDGTSGAEPPSEGPRWSTPSPLGLEVPWGVAFLPTGPRW